MKFLSRFSPAIVSGVALASLVGFAGNAQAQITETADSSLQVTITNNCVFATNPTASGGALTQSGTAPSNVPNLTGSFFVTCNMPNFGITAKSTSGGLINGAQLIPYSLTVASTGGIFTGGSTTGAGSLAAPQTVGTSSGFKAGCATVTGCEGTFIVDVDPVGTTAVPAGNYTDTITWTLTGS